jgi:predicted TIM-barrel fold metal-dependent hydrolase
MPYAEGRTYYDADSHIMELPDWLREFADPAVRDRLPPLDFSGGGRMIEALERLKGRKAHSPETVAELEKNVIAGPKGYDALGAFNAEERSRALDLLGFQRQLVFPTFSPLNSFQQPDLELRYGACRAHNRAMAAFCSADERLMGVGMVSLSDPEQAATEIALAIEGGLAALWIPPEPAGGRSPGHPDLDPIWARLAEAHVPFLLHVGGSPFKVDDAYWNTGKPLPTDWLGGGENIRSKDFTTLHQAAETFLSVLVLDGVLERFPTLRGGAIELGATWVPGMLRRIDYAAEVWYKSEPNLAEFSRRPSAQVREQLAFTPFSFEDVGAMIADSADDLFMFSSDYPHIEGGRNPLGRFERSLATVSDTARDRFYSGNFEKIFLL